MIFEYEKILSQGKSILCYMIILGFIQASILSMHRRIGISTELSFMHFSHIATFLIPFSLPSFQNINLVGIIRKKEKQKKLL